MSDLIKFHGYQYMQTMQNKYKEEMLYLSTHLQFYMGLEQNLFFVSNL